jgi:hypothetical protein
MKQKAPDDPFNEQETVRSREAALKRMLSTPHQPARGLMNRIPAASTCRLTFLGHPWGGHPIIIGDCHLYMRKGR